MDEVWKKRARPGNVIGCIYVAHPADGERYFLRLLLLHVAGPTSFSNLLGGCETFGAAALARGLLENDESHHLCMREAACVRWPDALRSLFVTLIVYYNVAEPRRLFEESYADMSEDFRHVPDGPLRLNAVLSDIDRTESTRLEPPSQTPCNA